MAQQTVIVSVLADTKKFSAAMRNLSRETGISKLTDGFKSLGSKIKGAFTTGIKVAGAFGIAMAGLAIKGGFERMLKIEDAQAKLAGLGHDTKEITAIMDDALASVKGTAYGLDTAANVASTAVAAGIAPGKQLEKYLRLTADAATIAGISMDEMGSILNKTTTGGKLMTREMKQLQDRGMPVMTWLQESYGKSAEEMQKMVSAGEVSAEEFRHILEDKIGGAALKSGDTTRGAFANMKAALSRVGVSLIEDVFPMFKDMFNGITTGLDNLTDALKPVGEAFGRWIEGTALPAVKRFGAWLRDDLWPVLKRVAATLSSAFATAVETVRGALERAGLSAGDTAGSFGDTLLVVLEKVTDVIGWVVEKVALLVGWFIENRKMITAVAAAITAGVVAFQAFNKILLIVRAAMVVFNVVMAANPIGLVIAAVAALVAGLVWFFTQTETGQKIVTVAWEAIKGAVAAVVEWFDTYVKPVLTEVWDTITNAVSAAADWFSTHVVPVFEAGGELLGAVFALIGQWATDLWENWLSPTFTFIADAWNGMWEGVQAVWEVIGPPITAAVSTAFEIMGTVLAAIWDNIKIVIETVLGVIKGIIETVTAIIKGDWSGAWEGIKKIASTVWNGIKALVSNSIETVKSVISRVVNAIRTFWSSTWGAVKAKALEIFENIKTGVRTKLDSLMTWVRDIPTKIKNVFANAGRWLLDAGKNIIMGLVNGIKNAFGFVKDSLSGLTNLLPSWKGPASKDKKILTGPGQMIIEGLIDGLEGQYAGVKKSLGGLTDMIAGTHFDPLAAPGLSAAGAGGRTGPVTIQVYALQDGPEVGRRVHEVLESFYRVNGRR